MIDDPRAAWLAEIATLMAQGGPVYPPGGTPAHPAEPRFVKFGGYLICPRCRYTEEFCGCDKPTPPPPTGDGVDSSLNKRIRDSRGGRT